MFSIPGSLTNANWRATTLSESIGFKDDAEIKLKLNELSHLCRVEPSGFMVEMSRRFTYGNEDEAKKIAEINAKIEEISKLIKIKSLPKVNNPFPNGRPATDEERQGIANYVDALMKRSEMSVSEGVASAVIWEFIEDPKKELILWREFTGSTRTFLYPSLYECSCGSSGKFNRFHNSRRADLETRMLQDLENFPKTKKLRYLSLGAGGALQDFINTGKLMRAGFQDLDIVLVDPYYRHVESLEKIKDQMSLLKAAAKELKISLNLSYVTSISMTEGNFHVVQAIDFDDFSEAFADLMASHSLLDEEGKFYLAHSDVDLIFDQKRCISTHFHDEVPKAKKVLGEIESHLTEAVNKEHLKLAFLHDEGRLLQWLKFLPALTKDAKEISLTLTQPQKTFFSGDLTGEPNAQFNPASLTRFIQLICDKPVSVTVISSYEEMKGEFDIITELFITEITPAVAEEIKWLHANHSSSQLFFSVQTYTHILQFGWKWDRQSGVQFFESSESKETRIINRLMSL